jgi:succinate dehydrogenase / fumarate reductase cytochrome b subunit
LLGGKANFLFRRLHSLTGILFGGYVLIHLAVNASLVEGLRYGVDGAGNPIPAYQTVYQQQVDKIHSLPFLWAISAVAILLPIVYHTIHGLYITLHGRPNVAQYGYTRNWLYMLQRVSALVLILFIAFHVLSFKGAFNAVLGNDLHFVPSRATPSTILHLQSHWWIGWVLYPIGILAATFHLANGFYAAGIAWGLTVSEAAQRRWGILCIGLFLFSTACGFTALVSSLAHPKVAPIDPGIPRVSISVPVDAT